MKCYGHLVDKVYKNKRELPFLFERIQEFYKMGDIKYSQSNFSQMPMILEYIPVLQMCAIMSRRQGWPRQDADKGDKGDKGGRQK